MTYLLILKQAVQSLAIAATVVLAMHIIIWLAGYSLVMTNALGDSAVRLIAPDSSE
jgi:hypothetical protein